ncbi:hypothetical protein [Campylobacter jejuni]|uniref:hypothetical protein n=1 Tax=Campylobacter jejuni TaxID=197 RepID=UPI000F80ED36|nr:hypothetical protein [Campylobacter jejuni]RTJ71749.1 hypothetical protein C3H53_09115 [Campylobacter jejuni]RTJ81140.1 hypothetical protein C3H50_09085 [Campylobacter jejuni]
MVKNKYDLKKETLKEIQKQFHRANRFSSLEQELELVKKIQNETNSFFNKKIQKLERELEKLEKGENTLNEVKVETNNQTLSY